MPFVNVKFRYANIDFYYSHRAYCSKLIWANQSFSDCLAVLYAYKNYHIRKNRGNFHRVIYRDGINVERKWCADRFISFKVKFFLKYH